jgi:hypothetical protein
MGALSSVEFRKGLPDFRPIEGLTQPNPFATDFSHSLFSKVWPPSSGSQRFQPFTVIILESPIKPTLSFNRIPQRSAPAVKKLSTNCKLFSVRFGNRHHQYTSSQLRAGNRNLSMAECAELHPSPLKST